MTNHTQNNDQVQYNDELDPQLQQFLDDLDNPIVESLYDEATEELRQQTDELETHITTGGEILDGVPDQVQESTRLDRIAQQRLELQHDDDYGSYESGGSTTEASAPNDVAREASRSSLGESRERLITSSHSHTERPIGELSDGVEDSIQESDEHSSPGISYEYQVAAVLPPVVQEAIQMALDHIGFGVATDRFQLLASFQVDTEEVLIINLREWVNKYIPIQTGFERVHNTVLGQNIYIAGWRLTNSQTIQRAQTALTVQLTSLITTTPNPEAVYTAFLPIMPSIPAELFPDAIKFLQSHFHAISWNIESIVLHRRMPESNNPWEMVIYIP